MLLSQLESPNLLFVSLLSAIIIGALLLNLTNSYINPSMIFSGFFSSTFIFVAINFLNQK